MPRNGRIALSLALNIDASYAVNEGALSNHIDLMISFRLLVYSSSVMSSCSYSSLSSLRIFEGVGFFFFFFFFFFFGGGFVGGGAVDAAEPCSISPVVGVKRA